MADFWVNGIVAARNHMPYVQLSNEKGMIAQLSMSEARKIAMDILIMASRTEMDAMVHKFFNDALDAPSDAVVAAMALFRDFRHERDMEKAEGGGDDDLDYVVTETTFGRWIVVKKTDPTLAWTGSLWDKHAGGVGIGKAQIANFDTESEAEKYARETIHRRPE
jgi:hypothetical protein